MATTLEERCEKIRTLADIAVLDTIRAGSGDDPRMPMVSALVAVREAMLAAVRDDARFAEYCAVLQAMCLGKADSLPRPLPENVQPLFPATQRG